MILNQFETSLAWRKRGVFAALTLSFAVVIAGCTAFPTDSGSQELEVRTNDNGLYITNKMDTSVYYFAVEREFASRINWAAVSRLENEVARGQTRVVEYGDIGGFAKGMEILRFYWATTDPASDNIRSVVISTDE